MFVWSGLACLVQYANVIPVCAAFFIVGNSIVVGMAKTFFGVREVCQQWKYLEANFHVYIKKDFRTAEHFLISPFPPNFAWKKIKTEISRHDSTFFLRLFQVRELVSECQCPTQFPMIRVSDGKYRIGDTKVLIFVRVSFQKKFLLRTKLVSIYKWIERPLTVFFKWMSVGFFTAHWRFWICRSYATTWWSESAEVGIRSSIIWTSTILVGAEQVSIGFNDIL